MVFRVHASSKQEAVLAHIIVLQSVKNGMLHGTQNNAVYC